MKVGVVQFPGTNCDRDVIQWLELEGHKTQILWHQDQFEAKNIEACVLPGGFSFGDYLRSGALAARSSVMKSVREMAALGKPILGICNGFQILCEAELLPGVLLPNSKGLFIDDCVGLNNPSNSKSISLPVAHGDGRYFLPTEELKKLWDQNQVWWTYTQDINGSSDKIAGVKSKTQNVKGLMPHPERAIHSWMESQDGLGFWLSSQGGM
jgi:phosphoribosylformylglycinamidine synthase subunit PurQ / glutaminase